ncbi:MAG: roadblock/LC7 domain-containing protein [Methylococcales bacterium]|nr:roadblock/LC7 domain-containing protein [Methylococcales bacterium]MDP3330397.1 roadblock/LC7 domain-containing protein [Methylococcaceae bacterium]MDP3838527.1 roadblock/LC7 domain-containing protein [Methylococcales bacterium]
MYKNILTHLNELDNSSMDIEASALVSVDGLVIATTMPLDMDVENIGAICAGAFSLGHRTSEQCAIGMLEQVFIKSAKNHIVITHAGTEAILAVIIKPYTNLEQLFSSLSQSVEKIAILI